jgi:hypothetical protein
MDVLVTAELLRARRRHTAFELALVRLVARDADRIARCGESVRRAVDGRGFAVASHSPTTFAMLVRGDDRGDTRARMDAALHALRIECFEDVSVAGVVAHAGGAPSTLSATDVLRAANAVLAAIPPDAWMRREDLHTESGLEGAPT